MNGKGSKPRPRKISRKKFARNWDRVFARVAQPEEQSPCKGKVAGSNPGRGHQSSFKL